MDWRLIKSPLCGPAVLKKESQRDDVERFSGELMVLGGYTCLAHPQIPDRIHTVGGGGGGGTDNMERGRIWEYTGLRLRVILAQL